MAWKMRDLGKKDTSSALRSGRREALRFLRGTGGNVLHSHCHVAVWNLYILKESTLRRLTRSK